MGDPEGMVLKTVTERAPSSDELAALHFGWKVVQHVKSNAIVLAVPDMTVGIGGGLPSRVDAVKLAVEKAGDRPCWPPMRFSPSQMVSRLPQLRV
jgi:phosphoribosylaminoimidazolecarboxamide formyltransferase/IMP cyclohydrolase